MNQMRQPISVALIIAAMALLASGRGACHAAGQTLPGTQPLDTQGDLSAQMITGIDRFLDRETARIDSLVAKVEQAIERLQEYRTALITAAVTGKIDVTASGLGGRHGLGDDSERPAGVVAYA